MELDLPAAVAGLQDVLPPLHAASASAAASATHLHASGAAAALHGDQLQQLLTLGDAAAQRIADLADAAAAAAGDAGAAAGAAKKDNGWLQPLVTGLETVLTFIEVGGGCGGCSGGGAGGGRALVMFRLSGADGQPGAGPRLRSLPQSTGPTPSSASPGPGTSTLTMTSTDSHHRLTTPVQDGLVRVGVPYSYGWSIVALTALIKLATFPLTKKQARPGPGPPAPFRPCLPPRVAARLPDLIPALAPAVHRPHISPPAHTP